MTIRRSAYTLSEVAYKLRVSRRTVERLVASGALPSVRIGGSRRMLIDVFHQIYPQAARDPEVPAVK